MFRGCHQDLASASIGRTIEPAIVLGITENRIGICANGTGVLRRTRGRVGEGAPRIEFSTGCWRQPAPVLVGRHARHRTGVNRYCVGCVLSVSREWWHDATIWPRLLTVESAIGSSFFNRCRTSRKRVACALALKGRKAHIPDFPQALHQQPANPENPRALTRRRSHPMAARPGRWDRGVRPFSRLRAAPLHLLSSAVPRAPAVTSMRLEDQRHGSDSNEGPRTGTPARRTPATWNAIPAPSHIRTVVSVSSRHAPGRRSGGAAVANVSCPDNR